jgi:hypothetical protein
MAPPPPPTTLVDNPQIKSAELLTPRPLFLHAYVWPFTIAWPVFLAFYLTPELYDKHIGGQEWTFVWMGTIITFQSLFWLSTHWSVSAKAIITARKVSSIEEAQQIKVIPVANAGVADISDLVRERVSLWAWPSVSGPGRVSLGLAECLWAWPSVSGPGRVSGAGGLKGLLADRLID